MQNALYITQVVLGGAVLLLILGAIGLVIFSACEKLLSRSFERGQQAQWEKDTRTLREHARWFSEDKPTMDLIAGLAENTDISLVRETWRKSRAKAP